MSAKGVFPEVTRRLAMMTEDEQRAWLSKMSPADLLRYDADFESWLHEGQREPEGDGWRTWLMMAGRGYGKTRAGAEWITKLATQKGKPVRIALVGATEAEVRRVMIEGPSGLLKTGRGHKRPVYEPSLGRLTWRGGSQAFIYSGENPDGLRGGEHHFAWCDELAKWAEPDEAWDMLQMTMRAGERPRTLVTTTPKPVPILKRIKAHSRTIVTTGRTGDNANLPPDAVDMLVETYGGTRMGRQELDGELLEDVEGALWPRALIEKARVSPLPNPSPAEGRGAIRRVVIGVDPPAGAGASSDACGIVAVGLGVDGKGYVLGDHSVAGQGPEGWARAVSDAALVHGADRVVAEANNGGAMVASVLLAGDAGLPVALVHASRGKVARAEPVAMLFEKGKAMFAGRFRELEDELSGFQIGGGYQGPSRSPDRADAMVWAMTELMLGKRCPEPRVRVL